MSAYDLEYDIGPSLFREQEIPKAIEEARQKKIEFGIEFLDDALIGLLPQDLCLIGAKPGYGKSAMGAHIAASNANFKNRVLFIALEAEKGEVEMRLKYQIIATQFYRDLGRARNVDLSYRAWRFGIYRDELARYEPAVRQIFAERYAFLDTVYRREKFDIHALQVLLEREAKEHDLVVLDHLHYMDLAGQRSSNEELGSLVQKIRNLNLFHSIPFIVIAHLRKDVNSLVPELSDFHGSGDIGKQATMAVMLSKDPDYQDFKHYRYGTVVSIPKSRTGGIGLVGRITFNGVYNQYELGYSLGRVMRSGEKERIESISAEDTPSWAKRIITRG